MTYIITKEYVLNWILVNQHKTKILLGYDEDIDVTLYFDLSSVEYCITYLRDKFKDDTFYINFGTRDWTEFIKEIPVIHEAEEQSTHHMYKYQDNDRYKISRKLSKAMIKYPDYIKNEVLS